MSNNRKSAAGGIYYTFGTIFLMAVITVCAINFAQDSRLMNKPAIAASANVMTTAKAAGDKTADSKDGGTKKAQTKPAGTKKAKTKPAETKPADNKPVNPGEEP